MENNPNSQQNILLPEEEGIDIKKYIFLILSHWWWFAITLFITLTIAYLINRYSQEEYNVSSSIIIGEPQTSSVGIDNILDELSRFKSRKRKAVVENEISILKSYFMAYHALKELDFGITYIAVGRRNITETHLYKDCPFIVIPDTLETLPKGKYDISILSKERYILSVGEEFKKELLFGQYFENNGIRFKLELRDPKNYFYNPQHSNKYYFVFNNINSLVNEYKNKLEVTVNDEKGSILLLSIDGFVPEKISDYLNKLSEVYIRSNLEEKNIASVNTIKFIDEQLRGIVDSLETTGLRLQKFRSANKVINLSKEGTYLFEKFQELQSDKAMLDIRERYYEYLLEYIKGKSDFSDVVAPSVIGIQDQLLNSLVARLNELNLQRRNLSLTVAENAPQLTIINNQILNTRNALEENLESLIKANSISKDELDERIVKIELEVQKLPSTERQMIDIEREFTINDQIYTFLLEKRAEAGITKASNTSDHKILDVAKPENVKIIKPKVSFNYMMALVLSGVMPLIIILLKEFFNSKITDRRFLENNLKAPIIGNIGHNDESSELPVNEKPNSSLAESFRALRTSLLYLLRKDGGKIISVTSAISGEGKTFCSVNLAGILAMSGKKTLIVSLDLRRPKIHRIFNLINKEGVSTYLIGKSSFDDLIIESNINNLFVSVSGPIPPNPAELIGSEQMKTFLEKARERFDYVIVDTPPIAIVTDTLLIKDFIDVLVFVIRHDYSDKQIIELINNIYENNLVKSLGVLVNDIQLKGYHGYSYRYGYGYGYGYSYSYRTAYYEEESNRKNVIGELKKRLRF